MRIKIFILALVLSNLNSFAQNISIANWLDNKKSATVFTFDDWSPGQYSFLANVASNKKLPFSVYVTIANSWQSDAYARMNTMVNLGCEIGNHTNSHPQLSKSTNLKYEIRTTLQTLNQNIQNQTITTLAYPFGDFNQIVIDSTKKLHIAARTVESTLNYWGYDFVKTNNDYYKIPTQEVNSFIGTKGVQKTINQGIENGGLVTLMYHSIFSQTLSDTWFDPIHIDTLNKMFDFALEKRNETWVTTLSNAVKYHKEKNSASLNLISNTPTLKTYSLTDTLQNNAIFNHPLTLNYTTSINEVIDSIVQGTTKLTFSTKTGIATFNAVPEAGNINIYFKSVPQGMVSNSISTNVNLYPNPSKGYFYLQSDQAFETDFELKIFDLLGTEISNYQLDKINDNTFKISTSLNGLFLIKVSSLHNSVTYKLQLGE